MEVAKNMDSVFTDAMDNDFDVMFDQEDSLIDTVNGVNESGDPLTGVDFEDLHQTQDDASAKDVKDGEADDELFGAKNVEGTNGYDTDDTSVNGEVDKDSDADKLYGDAETDYQEDKDNEPKQDETDINGMIDKVVEDVDAFLMESDDEDDISPEDMMGEDDEPVESCKKESADCDDSDVSVDSFEDEIQKESADDYVDKDVAAVDRSDMDEENEVIDTAIGKDDEDPDAADKYEYEPSDEDLIDMAINS